VTTTSTTPALTSHGYADAAVRLASLGFQVIDTYDRYAVFVRAAAESDPDR
jgi:hypothetical protein